MNAESGSVKLAEGWRREEGDTDLNEEDQPRMSAGAWQKAHGDPGWTPLLTYSDPTEESVQSQVNPF